MSDVSAESQEKGTPNLRETEPELYNIAERELNENKDLLIYAVNVKLGNLSVYDASELQEDIQSNRQLIEASRSLVDHVNNMYEQLKSIMTQVENKISESYNIIERAENKLQQKWYEAMPLSYKVGAGVVMLFGYFQNFLF